MNGKDARYVAETAALLSSRACSLNLNQGTHVAAREALELHRIATRLHRIDERNASDPGPEGHGLGCPRCDGSGTIKTPPGGNVTEYECRRCAGKGHILGRAEARAEDRAKAIGARYGMHVYFQGDCRGCPLYLIPHESVPSARADLVRDYAYPQELTGPPATMDVLQARWVASNYNRGVAVVHLG